MSPATPPPLQAKVRLPPMPSDAVRRSRLIEGLTVHQTPVWLISAPAGYGKTTLVRQAVEELPGRVCWVNLDRADNDPTRFWRHLAAAVTPAGSVLDSVLEQLDAATPSAAPDIVAGALEAQDNPVVLVLDDLHEVTQDSIHEGLGRLVSSPPDNLTVVIATRADPPLPLGRLRTQGRLAEARVGDLQFTLDETRALFANSLEAEDLQTVQDRTEGWATALRLLAASVGDDRSAGDLLRSAEDGHSDLAEFLRGEVLDRLNVDDTRFVIETSLLEVLEPGLCDHLTDRTDSLALLRQLTRDHVFTQLIDQASNTYRYHYLFGAFLRMRAEELGGNRQREIHELAAEWYIRREDPSKVIAHALAAGADDLALQTMKANFIPLAQAGMLATVDGWLTTYGQDRCRQDSELCRVAAWTSLNHQRYAEVEGWLDAASADLSTDTQAEVHTVRSHLARHLGDLAAALGEGRLAVEALSDVHSPLGSAANAALGAAMVLAGQDGLEPLHAAVTDGCAHDVDSSVVSGYAYLALSSSRQSGQPDETCGMADQALLLTATPALERFHQPAAAWLAKARAELEQGLLADAEEATTTAIAMADAGDEPLLGALAWCVHARIAHQRGRDDELRIALRTATEQAGSTAGQWIDNELKATRNDTRFAAVAADAGPAGAPALSAKEREVVALLPAGLSRRDLAGQLFISENTVKTHLTSIRHKLGVESGDDLVARVAELGLLGDAG